MRIRAIKFSKSMALMVARGATYKNANNDS